MATLAAILVIVAYNMSEWRTFVSELSAPKSDVLVLVTTFLLTVLVDLTVAIEVGMVAAAFLFMHRMAQVTNVSAVTIELEDGDDSYGDANSVMRREVPAGVEVFEINGPFFFGAAETFKDTIGRISGKPKVLIIRLRNVPSIDSTAMHALKDVVHRTRKEGTVVLLSDVHTQPLVAIGRSKVLDEIGEENLFGNIDDALNRARALIGLEPVERPEFAVPTVARETPAKGLNVVREKTSDRERA
jgi:SulP family sulfate permease